MQPHARGQGMGRALTRAGEQEEPRQGWGREGGRSPLDLESGSGVSVWASAGPRGCNASHVANCQ